MIVWGRVLATAVRASGRWAAVLAASALADSAARIALPAAIGVAVDAAIRGVSTTPVLVVAALLAVVTTAEVLREIAEVRARTRGTVALRTKIVEHLLESGLAVPARLGRARTLARLVESAEDAAVVVAVVARMLTSLLTSIGGTIGLFLVSVHIGLLVTVAAPLVWLATRWLIGWMVTLTVDYQNVHADLAERFATAAAGARTIRACGSVEREIDRVLQPLPALRAAGTRFWLAQRNAGWRLGLLTPLVQVITLAVAGLAVTGGTLTPGNLITVVGYLTMALGLLRQVAAVAQLAATKGSALAVSEVLSVPHPRAGTTARAAGPGELRLEQVSVGDVLSDVTLTVPAGSSVAIVGVSGSGKSALAEVAGGLRPPDSGRVVLDGVDLTDMSPPLRRAAFAHAFDRPVLFGDTVADTLSYSDEPTSMATGITDGAAEFVHKLADGVDTDLDDARFSGGEMQRLGLARALARRAPVLVLDDAASSVDTATEARIGAAITARAGTTTILVAHRQATASRATTVAWVADGRLRALAPHAELMSDPAYRTLFVAALAGPVAAAP